MKKLLIPVLAAVLTALFIASTSSAQPTPGIVTTAPLTGKGSYNTPITLSPCTADEVYRSLGVSGWQCSNVNPGSPDACPTGQVVMRIDPDGAPVCGVPDLSASYVATVLAGTNLGGGGTGGTVTLELAPIISLAGAANEPTLDILHSPTGETSPQPVARIIATGSVDTTGTPQTLPGLYIENTTTKTGSEALTNRGIVVDVSGGDTNDAIRVLNGDSHFQQVFADEVHAIGDTSFGSDPALNLHIFRGRAQMMGEYNGVGIDALNGPLSLADARDMEQGVGGGLVLTGESVAGSDTQYSAIAIKAMKSNGVDGDRCYDLVFGTRRGGTVSDPVTEAMRLECARHLVVKGSLTAGVDGDGTYDTVTLYGDVSVLPDSDGPTGDLSAAGLIYAANGFSSGNGITSVQGVNTFGAFHGTQIDVAFVTGALTDWNPTGLANATTIRAATTGSTDLVSMAGVGPDRKLTIKNTGSATIRVFHEYTTGTTASMRFSLPTNFVYIPPGGSLSFGYDDTSDRWRLETYYTQVDSWSVVGTLTADGNTTFTGTANTIGNANTDYLALRGMVFDTSTPPTVSSCGTSPGTPTGGSNWWRVTIGSGGVTACTFTFAATKTNTPICDVAVENAGEYAYISSVSGTAVTITAKTGTTDLSGDTITVRCLGDA